MAKCTIGSQFLGHSLSVGENLSWSSAQSNILERLISGHFVAGVCAFSARGPDSETTMNINENTVLVFENVDLNVCGGYDNRTGNVTLHCKNVDLNVSGGYTTGNVTLYCKNVDLNICGGYDNRTGNVTLHCKNVDLNVSGGYTTGNVTLYCKNVDLNICGGYDNRTGNVTLHCKNVDLNVSGGYTTGNVTLYCKNVDLNVYGGYDNRTGNVTSYLEMFLDNKRIGSVVPHFDVDFGEQIFIVGEDNSLCIVFGIVTWAAVNISP